MCTSGGSGGLPPVAAQTHAARCTLPFSLFPPLLLLQLPRLTQSLLLRRPPPPPTPTPHPPPQATPYLNKLPQQLSPEDRVLITDPMPHA